MTADASIVEFDAVLRFTKTDQDGTTALREHVVRFPCIADLEAAEETATRIADAIVEGLPKSGDNNRYGWKMARQPVSTITEV